MLTRPPVPATGFARYDAQPKLHLEPQSPIQSWKYTQSQNRSNLHSRQGSPSDLHLLSIEHSAPSINHSMNRQLYPNTVTLSPPRGGAEVNTMFFNPNSSFALALALLLCQDVQSSRPSFVSRIRLFDGGGSSLESGQMGEKLARVSACLRSRRRVKHGHGETWGRAVANGCSGGNGVRLDPGSVFREWDAKGRYVFRCCKSCRTRR